MATDHIQEISSATSCQGNMNQTCKVCGEPAAGFHFGAFTCEGCKSFFGRTYNNISSLNDCKNHGRCIINKKTRTSCKSCRLRKCLEVGMSKSGSRYGRRSNWFKIHYLMQSNNNNNDNTNETGSVNPIAISGNNNNLPNSSESPLSRLEHWDNSVVPTPDDSYALLALRYGKNSPNTSLPQSISHALSYNNENKAQTSLRLPTHQNLDSEIFLPTERKGISSPNQSSSDSHSSESSVKENGDVPFVPNFLPDPLYAKELLSLCNIPNIGQRFPPFLNPTSLTPRFLYPYFPNILSLYTRSQYIDTLLNEQPKASSEKDSGQKNGKSECKEPKEFQPPLKLFKPNPSSPRAFTVEYPWSSSSSPCYSPQSSSPKSWNSPTHTFQNKTGVKEDDKKDKSSDAQEQITPIDLSVKSKGHNGQEEKEEKDENETKQKQDYESDESFAEEKYKISFVIGEDFEKGENSKNEQQIPLDLSGFKT